MDFSKNGITTITDLNKHEGLSLLNSDKYWNPKLKDEFLTNLSSLWDASYYQEGIVKETIPAAVAEKQAA